MKALSNIVLISILLFLGSVTHAQEITYFSGFFGDTHYQDDVKISKKEVASIVRTNDLSKVFWDKHIRHRNYSYIAAGVQFGLLIYGINRIEDGSVNYLYASVGAGLVGVGFALSSQALKRKAILSYNNGLDGGISSVDLIPAPNGLGLRMTF